MGAPEWTRLAIGHADEQFMISVNGKQHTVRCHPETPMLYVLRNHLGLKGTRFGCGLGQCGACYILVNGRPTSSCDLPVRASAGQDVTTADGLGADRIGNVLQRCFIELQAAQCAYCMSGILMSATSLLKNNARPDSTEVRRSLDCHLCRCGSHARVVKAVLMAAELVTPGGEK